MTINRNYLWAQLFARVLEESGITHVCISPGSRSTPLTSAFARNDAFTKHVFYDERVMAFFALGLAKASLTPVVLVCTSGTAAAELYPAVIEAYQTRTPLIVCTADRPDYLRGCGENQTINQFGMYANHIRGSYEMPLPEMKSTEIKKLLRIANTAVDTAWTADRGPVHLNFPFEKPLESAAHDASVDMAKIELLYAAAHRQNLSKRARFSQKKPAFPIRELRTEMRDVKTAVIIVGPSDYRKTDIDAILRLAEEKQIPVFADAASQLRFSKTSAAILTSYHYFCRHPEFIKNYSPESILQFGRTPVSINLAEFLRGFKGNRYVIQEYDDPIDPQRTAKIIHAPIKEFCESVHELFRSFLDTVYSDALKQIETKVERIREEETRSAKKNADGKALRLAVNALPEGCDCFLSNSMPVRDFDALIPHQSRDCRIYENRGASGIDGIISTAAGACTASGRKMILLTGDLSFFYDLNGLTAARSVPAAFVIVVFNNGGGTIFREIPIAKETDILEQYFVTPPQISIARVVKALDIPHTKCTSAEKLPSLIKAALSGSSVHVIEFFGDAEASHTLRKRLRDRAFSL